MEHNEKLINKGVSCICFSLFSIVIKIRYGFEEHFDSKISFIKSEDLSKVPKIYFYNNLLIIEERVKIISHDHYMNNITKIWDYFELFGDIKPCNIGINKKGDYVIVDYSMYGEHCID